jgi:hypothetical protein
MHTWSSDWKRATIIIIIIINIIIITSCQHSGNPPRSTDPKYRAWKDLGHTNAMCNVRAPTQPQNKSRGCCRWDHGRTTCAHGCSKYRPGPRNGNCGAGRGGGQRYSKYGARLRHLQHERIPPSSGVVFHLSQK